jgi:hypothetical protein
MRRRSRRLLQTVTEDCGNVVGVVEAVLSDDLRQESLEVVVVGLGPTQRRAERAEGGGGDRRGVLLLGESRAPQEFDEVVALCFRGDRFKFCCLPVDAAVEVELCRVSV